MNLCLWHPNRSTAGSCWKDKWSTPRMNTDDPLRYAHRHLPWRSADLLRFNCRIFSLSTCFRVSRIEHVFSYATSAVKSLRVRRFVVSYYAFYRSTPWLCAWLQTSSRRFPRGFGARHFVVQYPANLQILCDVCHKTLSKSWNSEKLFCMPHTLCPSSWHCYNSHLFDMWKLIPCSEIFNVAFCSASSLRHLKFPFPKSVSTMVQNVFAVTFFRLYLQDSALISFCVAWDFYFASTASLFFRHAFGVELSNASWSH